MARALITIRSSADRARATSWIAQAPTGTRVEFKASKRSLPQNDRMWAMLTDVSRQKEHAGRKFTPNQWKVLFMAACGMELELVPSLNGSDLVPLGYHSSDLDKEEMSELIEFMFAWGAENGITFNDPMESPSIAPAQEAVG